VLSCQSWSWRTNWVFKGKKIVEFLCMNMICGESKFSVLFEIVSTRSYHWKSLKGEKKKRFSSVQLYKLFAYLEDFANLNLVKRFEKQNVNCGSTVLIRQMYGSKQSIQTTMAQYLFYVFTPSVPI